jgi:hypothetical protein
VLKSTILVAEFLSSQTFFFYASKWHLGRRAQKAPRRICGYFTLLWLGSISKWQKQKTKVGFVIISGYQWLTTWHADRALQVTVLRKEKLVLVFSSPAIRERAFSELTECIEFASAGKCLSQRSVLG